MLLSLLLLVLLLFLFNPLGVVGGFVPTLGLFLSVAVLPVTVEFGFVVVVAGLVVAGLVVPGFVTTGLVVAGLVVAGLVAGLMDGFDTVFFYLFNPILLSLPVPLLFNVLLPLLFRLVEVLGVPIFELVLDS